MEQCPACGRDELVPIVYGYPSFEMGEQSAAGEILLGGCLLWEGQPTHRCRHCGEAVRQDPPAGA